MQAKPIAESMDKPADGNFGLGILTPHQCHLSAAPRIDGRTHDERRNTSTCAL
jgi:hypothetical protein